MSSTVEITIQELLHQYPGVFDSYHDALACFCTEQGWGEKKYFVLTSQEVIRADIIGGNKRPSCETIQLLQIVKLELEHGRKNQSWVDLHGARELSLLCEFENDDLVQRFSGLVRQAMKMPSQPHRPAAPANLAEQLEMLARLHLYQTITDEE
jgi:hypothetical protein